MTTDPIREYQESVRELFKLRADGPALHERDIRRDWQALEAFNRLDAATKRLEAHLSQPQPVAQGEAVTLDAPALVGNTQFGIGVPWASVIRCAQRRYLHKDDTALTQEQIAEFREALIQPTIPTGQRVVPIEPTEAMYEAADAALKSATVKVTIGPAAGSTLIREPNRVIYKAMLAAAPETGCV